MSILSAKLSKKDIVKIYSKTALFYDLWGTLTETKARKKALDLAQIKDGESILEVALGTGLTFLEILKRNPSGLNQGIDLTPAMLEKAKTKAEKSGHTNFNIEAGDAYSLQFPDNHFDVLMNNYMFDLLPENDFTAVLVEFKRVLKPDGRIVLINMTKGERFYQRFWELVYRINPSWLGGCRGVLLKEALKQNGYQNIHRETVSQFGFPSEVITATCG
jgi:ubiquinone/menaquinone biosynthesis C-methylase UbiE